MNENYTFNKELNNHFYYILYSIIKIMSEYTIYMYIYDEYVRFKSHFSNINEFVYKNRISSVIQYYKDNIQHLGNENKIHYNYYKEFELNVIEIIQAKIPDIFVPPYRLLIYNDIRENSFGIHRFGWKNVIANFVSKNYWENDHFYYDHPEFEWVSYALEYNLDDYLSAKLHYLQNIKYIKQMKYKKMKFIIFDEWLDRKYLWGSTKKKPEYKYPFMSFIHNPPLYQLPDDLYNEFQAHDTIQLLTKNEDFLEEKKNLKILITLSDDHKKFIERNEILDRITIVKNVYHPLELSNKKYSFDIQAFIENENKSIFMIGWWLRKYDIFFKLSCNKTIIMKNNESMVANNYFLTEIRKIVAPENINYDRIQQSFFSYEEIYLFEKKYHTTIYEYLNNEKYDQIFYNNIVFLDVYATSANNILLECIMNNTPILVSSYPSIIEYLGIDYPLYFTNYKDAESKSNNIELIIRTHLYLKNMDKTQFTYQYFSEKMKDIIVSNIY
jgi:hypothetical protein